MAKVFENQRFDGLTDIDTGTAIKDMEFRSCDFISSSISMGMDPKLRTVVRRVRLHNCRVRASFVGRAFLDEVEVDGLDTGRRFYLEASAAVYCHVVFSGSIGRIMLSESVGLVSQQVQRLFDAANEELYRRIDWAIDISKAEFYECAIPGVPYHLVRRDAETQVVVQRERAAARGWETLDLPLYWRYCLEGLVAGTRAGIVLVAPKSHPKFRESLKGLELLRRAGIADEG